MRRLDRPATAGEQNDDQLLRLYAAPAEAERWVRMMFVSSVDGAAALEDRSGGLGSAADRRVFNLARRDADVILVGAGTVRAEGYEGELLDSAARRWRLEHGMSAHPDVAVVSGTLGLDPDSAFFTQAPVRPLIVTTHAACAADPEHADRLAEVADVLRCGRQQVDPVAVLRNLGERGHRVIHGEGGPALFGAFAAADTVDELQLSLSPLLAGPEGPRILGGAAEASVLPTSLRLAHVLEENSMLLLRYLVERS